MNVSLLGLLAAREIVISGSPFPSKTIKFVVQSLDTAQFRDVYYSTPVGKTATGWGSSGSRDRGDYNAWVTIEDEAKAKETFGSPKPSSDVPQPTANTYKPPTDATSVGDKAIPVGPNETPIAPTEVKPAPTAGGLVLLLLIGAALILGRRK